MTTTTLCEGKQSFAGDSLSKVCGVSVKFLFSCFPSHPQKPNVNSTRKSSRQRVSKTQTNFGETGQEQGGIGSRLSEHPTLPLRQKEKAQKSAHTKRNSDIRFLPQQNKKRASKGTPTGQGQRRQIRPTSGPCQCTQPFIRHAVLHVCWRRFV